MDVSIHQKVIQFITLLLAHNCIIMDDLIKYVIMKILKAALGGGGKPCLWLIHETGQSVGQSVSHI